MPVLDRITRRLRIFRHRTGGSVTIEIIFALLILNLFLSAFAMIWVAYNAYALADRATYTINDLITRQRGVTLQRSFLDGLEQTAEFIIDPDQNAALRFTQVTRVAGATANDPPTIRVDWSYSPCGVLPAAVPGPDFSEASLPMMAVGATMLVTDMQVPYVSTFDLFPSLTFERRAVSLYRFEPSFTLAGVGASSCPS